MADPLRNGLFGSCGVRGIVGEQINDEVIDRLARSFATHLGHGARVCVGRDTRRSGPELEERMVSELCRYGIDITRLGVVSTPALYFLTRELGFDAGVMVTASHNPANCNGFKFCTSTGMSADQQAIENGYYHSPSVNGHASGAVERLAGADLYFRRLAALCPPPRKKQKLVVDCACGPNSLFLPAFLRAQGHEVLECNCVPDVERCDRALEPMPDTLENTIAFLHDNSADAGICLDGDNDRVVFLDREGPLGFQRANAIVSIMALEDQPGKDVVGSVETGRYVEEAVRHAGGQLHRTVVGDIHVARVVQQRSAALGVEECGHYILPRLGCFSSTVYATCLLLAKRDINAIKAELSFIPPLCAREERVACDDAVKKTAMASIGQRMLASDGEATTIDGARLDWDDGWLLVRPSGTSPYMKVNAEAFTGKRLDELVSLGLTLIQEALS